MCNAFGGGIRRKMKTSRTLTIRNDRRRLFMNFDEGEEMGSFPISARNALFLGSSVSASGAVTGILVKAIQNAFELMYNQALGSRCWLRATPYKRLVGVMGE